MLSLQRREFCFTLENDVFVRYQSFKDCAELHAAVRDRHACAVRCSVPFARPYYARRRCPAKIDIGPIFNVDPQKRSAYGGLGSDRVFAPVERELVFDVVRCLCFPVLPGIRVVYADTLCA